MKRTSFAFLFLTAALLAAYYLGCRQTTKHALADRPNDPFVFRSVMDKRPRMVTIALHDNLWASYSADSCSLYKTWKGGVDFVGAVYNMQHGPQPMSIGNAWFVNAHPRPWRVETGGQSERPAVDYKGHRLVGDGAEIYFDLVMKNGQRIRVNERPEYVERDGQPGFERQFSVENAPAGTTIFLETNAASIVAESNIETENGQFFIKNKEKEAGSKLTTVEVDGEVSLSNNKKTTLRTWFVNHPTVENPNNAEMLAEASKMTPGERIINKSDCRTCHNPTDKTVGPAYAEIAKKYLNTPENVEKLTQKVKLGGAGVWGLAAMSAHPDLADSDIKTVVQYVLDFDKKDDQGEGKKGGAAAKILQPEENINLEGLAGGLSARAWVLSKSLSALKDIDWAAKPAISGVLEKVDLLDSDFAQLGLMDNFAASAEGYLSLNEDKNIDFRLSSDDGSRLFINGQLMIDNDGPHGMTPADCEVQLKKGYHKIRVDYFQGGGGRGLQLMWAPHGSTSFEVIPPAFFVHGRLEAAAETKLGGAGVDIPGDLLPLAEVHPSYTLSQARPDWFLPKVGGMDFDKKGNLYVSTWDASGSIYRLSGTETGDPKKIKCVQIAKGLAEPLGVKIVDDTLFVLQKQEVTKLVDTDGDGIMDDYQSFAKGWRASANFHEFAFGLAYKDGFFYATLATAINPGGASTRPQIPDRGKVVKIDRKTGQIEFIANGLRTPNGIGIGADNELFVADNQGDWLPACKILHVKPGAFYNSFSVDSVGNAGKTVTPPVVWLPQDEIGNSASQPSFFMDESPYKGQMLHGDVCYGGIQRVFVEKIDGDYQGCVFKFSQGIEAGINRVTWGPDGALYLGGIGAPGNWGHAGGLWYGLQKMKFNGNSTFEMLAVRAKSDGIEVEFTEPLAEGDGWDAADYSIKQWWYKPTAQYGGPKMDEIPLPVRSANVSSDRRKVFLEIPGIKPGQVVYIRLKNTMQSELEHEIWTTEGWYTMNKIPAGQPGQRSVAPPTAPKVGDNELSEREKKAGFQLLFDGKSISGWRNFKKTDLGKGWVIDQNAIHLDAKPSGTGHWQAADGGDIVTLDEYENFDLRLDWKIGECGNSGIIFNVVEDKNYEYVWQTGPEMQVLDNSCHPDAKIPMHRAGDLYDLIACKFETVKPAGEWNSARLRIENGHLQQWLNGRKVVDTQMWTPEWNALVKKSKFAEMKGFGKAKKGRISLQDHGNLVWFKNLKIRRL